MAVENGQGPKRTLTAFTLAMINVAAVVSLKNLPFMAEYGWAMIFYYCLAALAMFIPTALVSAELATAWPKTGGVYIWVREAFGARSGFLAVWLQWVNNIPYFPSILAFLASALAFTFVPAWQDSRYFALAVVLIATWGVTFLNFRGMKLSGLFSSVGAVAGTLVPGVLLILLAAAWLGSGKTNELPFSAGQLIPPMGSLSQIVLAAGVLLSFAGMEMSAVHAREVKNPQRDYPKAILISALIILALSVVGSLSIAVAVPKEKARPGDRHLRELLRSCSTGSGLGWMTEVVSFLIAIGVLATVSTWVIGPSKGLFATAADGELPPTFQKLNRHHVPRNVLIMQAAVVSVVAVIVFVFMPSVDGALLDPDGADGSGLSPDVRHHVHRGDQAALRPARGRAALQGAGRQSGHVDRLRHRRRRRSRRYHPRLRAAPGHDGQHRLLRVVLDRRARACGPGALRRAQIAAAKLDRPGPMKSMGRGQT